MKYLTIACIAAVGAQAFTIEDVKNAVEEQDTTQISDDLDAYVDGVVSDLKKQKGNFLDDVKEKFMDTDAYLKLDDWWTNFEPTTVHDSYEWAHKNVRKLKPRTAAQMSDARRLHKRVAERRAASGRKPLLTVSQIHSLGKKDSLGSDIFLDYDYFDNAANTLYSFVTGFIYIPGESSQCSDSILNSLGAWINAIDTTKKIYLPMNWPNWLVSAQDIVASGADITYTCDINKLFTTVSHLFTTEGLTELGARFAGAAPFQLIQTFDVLRDGEVSSAETARVVGGLVATLTNYHI